MVNVCFFPGSATVSVAILRAERPRPQDANNQQTALKTGPRILLDILRLSLRTDLGYSPDSGHTGHIRRERNGEQS